MKGTEGKPISSANGVCTTHGGDDNWACAGYFDKKSCTGNNFCQWSSDGETKLSGGEKAGYIVGGLFTILFGIGIVMIANWIRNKTRTDRNFAAVVGTGALAEGIANAFRTGR